jgi:hypothetical protein
MEAPVVKCKKGSPRRWLVLGSDGVLAFYADRTIKTRKGSSLDRGTVRVLAGAEHCEDGSPHWTAKVDPACRFKLSAAHRPDSTLNYLEAASPEPAAEWATAINAFLRGTGGNGGAPTTSSPVPQLTPTASRAPRRRRCSWRYRAQKAISPP